MKKVLSILSALILLAAGLPLSVSAEEIFTEGDFSYSVYSEKATVEGYHGQNGAVTIPATLGGYPVTRIGWSAFAGTAITSVVVPDQVTEVYGTAFENCTSLTRVTFGRGIEEWEAGVFRGCTSLKEVTLPATLRNTGRDTFLGCTSLQRIVLPDSLTVVDWNCFSGCTKLAEVVFPSGLTRYPTRHFSGARP